MSKRTQKVGAAARFGPRYGVSVRRNAAKILRKRARKYSCPVCQYQKVTRDAVGIWTCGKCGHNFAGGAWEPFTRASVANNRIIRRSVDGATVSDMALIAQQAAFDYELRIAEAEKDEEE